VTRRPFASASDRDDLDFNEVFFTDARVPAENLVGPFNQGWRVATGSLGHERTMLWLGYADRLRELLADFRPSGVLGRDQYATLATDFEALRLLGSAALARADRGEEDVPGLSVLKLLGSESLQMASEQALSAAGADGLVHPAFTGPFAPLNLDDHYGSWFDRYFRSFAGTIAGGTSVIQRNIIAERILGLPRN
jgi:alkylation response protein AidB-like acyl-CoA dehydrogenase